ncbi:HEPN domain-containing protein [Candidatus Harpocratesius sp.]
MVRKQCYIWAEEAWNDYEMAKILIAASKFNGAVFHAQQAAEKMVKALHFQFNSQPWGHSITKLFQEIEVNLNDIPAYIKSYAMELDRHYTTSRYPDVLPGLTPKDVYDQNAAEDVMHKALEILNYLYSIIQKSKK